MSRTTSQGVYSTTYRSLSKNSNQNPLRIAGVDDAALWESRERIGSTVLVVVLLQGTQILDLRLGSIEIDGLDAQSVLVSLLNGLSYDAVMLSGVSFGGFNLIDILELAGSIHKPVIAVIREMPNNRAVHDALRKHFHDWRQRWKMIQDAGALYSCRPVADEPRLYFEVKGASQIFARNTICSSSAVSRLPEPVRVAGIIAKGLRGYLTRLDEIDEANLQRL